ncbi:MULTISPECIES: 50S ribosomal protein L19 [unclassified Mycoplasma]|uniref:50S ribosomal protein L19 n=1 Tax=unclassified Mycoplasma TaxID=2683645 RepID=UPI000FDEC918
MRHKLLTHVDEQSRRDDLGDFRPGENVKVYVRIREGSKERIQVFEGLVIAIKNSGASKSFTVRKISYGIGVERTFPLNSPIISHVDVVRRNKVRRAKLYYMRERSGKAARLKQIVAKKAAPSAPNQSAKSR